jgi:hypothetical protein
LEEFGRNDDEFWDNGHIQKISSWFQKNAPKIGLDSARLGGSLAV